MTAKNFLQLPPASKQFHLSQMNPQQLQQLCNELESLQRHYSALAEKVKASECSASLLKIPHGKPRRIISRTGAIRAAPTRQDSQHASTVTPHYKKRVTACKRDTP